MAGPTDGYPTDAPYRIAFQASQTPAHLALVCATAGMAWAMRDDLQVADLGCGRGYVANTLAAANPEWRVVGIDHSPVQIAEAAMTARRAGLDNVEFIEADLGALADAGIARLPQFDVVMLHGLWTWVSDAVRDGIGRLLLQRLRPGALVYVGYNVLPAAAADFALQRLLRQLAGPRHDSGGSVIAAERAMARLRGLAGSLPLPRTAMLERLMNDPPLLEPAFVAHEFLTDHWRPVFHEELCAALAACKLDFVGSCNLFESLPGLLDDPERDRLLREAAPGQAREFLKDLCLPRSFRADVFVRGARAADPVRALDTMVVAATRALPERSPVLDTGVSRATWPQPLWEALRGRLEQGPCEVAELRAVRARDALHPAELLSMLVGSALVQPIFRATAAGPAASAARFNRAVAALHAQGGDGRGHFALAAHAAAGGLPADALDLALVSALSAAGPASDPSALALAIQPNATPGERELLTTRVAARLAERLAAWRRFGIL
ncbi:MAG: class I SAM-dependent methyltransferase [Burkholderiaceae bacterium]|nr:class I SAM-dependent methyltransferase [Burkholderiaceae bacterium]